MENKKAKSMGTPASTREPCADRIVDNVGSAFATGVVGGSVLHFTRGIYNFPGARLSGGAQYVRMHVPKVGGSFAVWYGLCSTFECAMVYARQKEDRWNSILAGAATGGLLSIRQGLRASGRSILFGGVIIALVDGASISMNKAMRAAQNEQVFTGDAASVPNGVPMETSSASEAGSGSWFGGLFGNGKKKESEEKTGTKTQILESFDAPPVPTFRD